MSNTQYEIIEGGVSTSSLKTDADFEQNAVNKVKQNGSYIKDEKDYYPQPVKGMKVRYTSNGQLSNITFPEGVKDLSMSSIPAKGISRMTNSGEVFPRGDLVQIASWGGWPNRLYRISGSNNRYGTGQATTFTDRIGQANIVLSKGSVATKLSVDNCKVGTAVYVTANIYGTNTKKTVKMVKQDAGGMYNAIVDIWNTGVTYWGYPSNWAQRDLSLYGTVSMNHTW